MDFELPFLLAIIVSVPYVAGRVSILLNQKGELLLRALVLCVSIFSTYTLAKCSSVTLVGAHIATQHLELFALIPCAALTAGCWKLFEWGRRSVVEDEGLRGRAQKAEEALKDAARRMHGMESEVKETAESIAREHGHYREDMQAMQSKIDGLSKKVGQMGENLATVASGWDAMLEEHKEMQNGYNKTVEEYKRMVEFYRGDAQRREGEEHGEGGLKIGGAEEEGISPEYADLPEAVGAVIPKALEMLKTEGVGPWLEMIPEEVVSGRYRPVHHRILLAIRKILSKGGGPTISDISSITGINRKELKVFLQEMNHEGFVRAKVEGKSVLYRLPDKGFVKDAFQPVLRSQREGGEFAFQLILKARDHYLGKGWMFTPLKQIPGISMPDAVAVPPKGKRAREGWNFADAVAVEVETPDEIRAHPDQVLLNVVKNFAAGWKHVEIWCTKDSADKVSELYVGRIPNELSTMVSMVIVPMGSEKYSQAKVGKVSKRGSKGTPK